MQKAALSSAGRTASLPRSSPMAVTQLARHASAPTAHFDPTFLSTRQVVEDSSSAARVPLVRTPASPPPPSEAPSQQVPGRVPVLSPQQQALTPASMEALRKASNIGRLERQRRLTPSSFKYTLLAQSVRVLITPPRASPGHQHIFPTPPTIILGIWPQSQH